VNPNLVSNDIINTLCVSIKHTLPSKITVPSTWYAVFQSSKQAMNLQPAASLSQQLVFEGRNIKATALYLTHRKKYTPPFPAATICTPSG